jgi:hypothetical protein
MRLRKPPAIAFGLLTLASAYLGFLPSTIPTYGQSDKVLHFVTFFLLTVTKPPTYLHIYVYIPYFTYTDSYYNSYHSTGS